MQCSDSRCTSNDFVARHRHDMILVVLLASRSYQTAEETALLTFHTAVQRQRMNGIGLFPSCSFLRFERSHERPALMDGSNMYYCCTRTIAASKKYIKTVRYGYASTNPKYGFVLILEASPAFRLSWPHAAAPRAGLLLEKNRVQVASLTWRSVALVCGVYGAAGVLLLLLALGLVDVVGVVDVRSMAM